MKTGSGSTPSSPRSVPTNLSPALSEQQVREVRKAFIVMADDYLPEIDFPYHAQKSVVMGLHPFAKEAMFFFPNVKTEHIYPVYLDEVLGGRRYLLAALPDTEMPYGQVGLMYVCRQISPTATFQEVIQWRLDIHDAAWIVREPNDRTFQTSENSPVGL